MEEQYKTTSFALNKVFKLVRDPRDFLLQSQICMVFYEGADQLLGVFYARVAGCDEVIKGIFFLFSFVFNGSYGVY